jgi:hypothetical protein
MEEKIYKIAIANADNENFAGAYLEGSIEDEEAVLFLNLKMIAQHANNTKEYIDGIHETAVHEFCHLMQDLLNKDLSELETDKILKGLNPNWGERDEDPEFSVYSLLDWLQEQGDTIKKKDIVRLFRAMTLQYAEHRNIPLSEVQ